MSLPVAMQKAPAGRDSGPKGILLLLEIKKLYAIGPIPKRANRSRRSFTAVMVEEEPNS
jgi:hypothetical protein